MESFLQQFKDLKIQLEEIKSATNNFDDKNNYIGCGGFGKVYKGEVFHSKGRSMVALKRLDRRHGQGTPEFVKEITMLSRYRHPNLISLMGFCYQEDEMILAYEHASRGSLDRHLNSSQLSWTQRLKICLDIAKGLSYLHDPRGTHQRVIHCDIKSANILLDDQWNSKVSDFGLSIIGPANEQHSTIVTIAAGTVGYYDPQYAMTHTLTKESDVYSLGVVLFEVLCGALCNTYSNDRVPQTLVPTWIKSYKQNKLNEIIFKDPAIQPMDQNCLKTFSDIAYQCLKVSREDRPKMAEVVKELETALESQEFSERKSPFDYEEMTNTAEPPLNYSSKGELRKLLSKGVLLNGGKTWFSLNKNREHCEMISFAECLDSAPNVLESNPQSSEYNSRFVMGPYHYKNGSVKAHVKTQFLTPLITYAVDFVFKFTDPKKVSKSHEPISIKYKLQGETKTSISYLACERDDGWWMCEIYQFTSDHRIVELEILFDGFGHFYDFIEAEGIEFRPIEKVEHLNENQPVSDSDSDCYTNWEESLPTDYEDIMKCSKNRVQWTTKKEAYSIIRKGLLINDGQEWFSCDKNGKKCHMLSARATCTKGRKGPYWLSLPESRFGEAVQVALWRELKIDSKIQSQLLSSQTTYATYLVYKFSKHQSGWEAPLKVEDEDYLGLGDNICYIYLVRPQTPVIRPKADQNTHRPLNMPKIKGLPQQRNDGWMEVQIWEFQIQNAITTKNILANLQLTSCGENIPRGLIIQGIEFRPI